MNNEIFCLECPMMNGVSICRGHKHDNDSDGLGPMMISTGSLPIEGETFGGFIEGSVDESPYGGDEQPYRYYNIINFTFVISFVAIIIALYRY